MNRAAEVWAKTALGTLAHCDPHPSRRRQGAVRAVDPGSGRRSTRSSRAGSSSSAPTSAPSRRRPRVTLASARPSVSETEPTPSVLVSTRSGSVPGDEVICPSFTFFATAGAMRAARRRCSRTSTRDVQPRSERVASGSRRGRRRSCRCTCSGGPRRSRSSSELGVPLIEDAAQAFGSPEIARTGVASTFSFYPTKNLFGLGDGGLIVDDDGELADAFACSVFTDRRRRDLRVHRDELETQPVQAAVLRIFLRELDSWTALRREAAERYRELGLGDACQVPVQSRATSTTCWSCARRSGTRSGLR